MAYIPSDWQAEQNFPQLKIASHGSMVREKYYTEWGNITNPDTIPNVGDVYSGIFDLIPETQNMIVSNISITPSPAQGLAHIEIEYKVKDKVEMPGDDRGEPEFDLEDGGLQKPIEENPNYKMCWNHFLIGIEGSTSSTWWTSATDGSDTVESTEFQWVKSVDNVPFTDADGNKWVKLQDPIKPDVETYLVGAPIVNEIQRFKDIEDASAVTLNIGKRVVPDETFTLDATDTHWLIVSAQVVFDGDFWVTTRRFQYADNVDTDIYDTP